MTESYLRSSFLHTLLNALCFPDAESVKSGDWPEVEK